MTVDEKYRGIEYVVTAIPVGAGWRFGDGAGDSYPDSSGYGLAYPEASTVTHTYQAHDQAGYGVSSSVRYTVSWTAYVNGRSVGPYPLGTVDLAAAPLRYPVEQAQPELVELGRVR
jgi:hypothetical protein